MRNHLRMPRGVVILFLFGLLYRSVVWAQDCRVSGESCSDDNSCCGGCCLEHTCKDTHMDCRTAGLPMDDPCLDLYCPPEEICYTYQPPDCRGCGPITACRSTDYVPDERLTNSHVHMIPISGSIPLFSNHIVMYLVLVIALCMFGY